MLHKHYYWTKPRKTFKVAIIIIPFLEMREIKYVEIKSLFKALTENQV